MARRAARPGSRRQWLRAAALMIGLLVFVAHIVTLKITPLPGVEFRDLTMHFAMLFTFALAYRLSFSGSPVAADWAALLVCSGWGATCEALQIWHPARYFNLSELAVNALTPAFVVMLFVAARHRL